MQAETVDPVLAFLANQSGARAPVGAQADAVSTQLASTVERLGKMAESQGYAKILSNLLGENPKPQQADPAQNIQAITSVAKDLAGIDAARTSDLRQELEASRRREREATEAAMKLQSQGSGENMAFMKMILDQNERNERRISEVVNTYEARLAQRDEAHRREMQELKAGLQQRPSSPWEAYGNKLIEEQLFGPKQSAIDEIAEAQNKLKSLGLYHDSPSPNASSAHEYQYMLSRDELEMKFKLEEMKINAEIEKEKRKSKKNESVYEFLGAAVALFTGKTPPPNAGTPGPFGPGGNTGFNPQGQPMAYNQQGYAPQPQQQAPQPSQGPAPAEAKYRYKCNHCEREMLANGLVASAPCPHCKQGQLLPQIAGAPQAQPQAPQYAPPTASQLMASRLMGQSVEDDEEFEEEEFDEDAPQMYGGYGRGFGDHERLNDETDSL